MNPPSDISRLLRAISFAAEKHRNQRRKDEEASPYINHPIALAALLVSVGGIEDVVVLQAAILHDTVEDTDTSFAELAEHFGDEVASIVREVTDDKNLDKAQRKQMQIDHAPHASRAATCAMSSTHRPRTGRWSGVKPTSTGPAAWSMACRASTTRCWQNSTPPSPLDPEPAPGAMRHPGP
jgi:(p)ppGpp synthase/HD superfamily hydrolase